MITLEKKNTQLIIVKITAKRIVGGIVPLVVIVLIVDVLIFCY
jgi:hypothetical protein